MGPAASAVPAVSWIRTLTSVVPNDRMGMGWDGEFHLTWKNRESLYIMGIWYMGVSLHGGFPPNLHTPSADHF